MSGWWLLHGVGDADLGVSSDRNNTERVDQRERRLSALWEITDPVQLGDRLVRLRWGDAVSGDRSPLAAITDALSPGDPVRLVLVATGSTQPIADALATALSRAPEAFGRALAAEVVPVGGTAASGGLTEDAVATALASSLVSADENDQVLITWGSGSTQLALGAVEAAVRARLRWLFATVGSPRTAQRYVLLDPGQGLGVNPLVPLLRRWRYHDRLADLVEKGQITVSPALRLEVLADRERWQQAHLRPTAENLRGLMTDALMRGDATSYFAVRAYVFAQYQQLRERHNPSALDLVAWVQQRYGKSQLGEIREAVRRATDQDVMKSRGSASGKWLTSKTVGTLNEAGIRAGHELAPPSARLRRELREHLAAVPTDRSPVPDPAALLPAMGAWYVAIVGREASRAEIRRHPLQAVAETSADPEVARYLGMQDPADVDRRYLVLGTAEGTEHDAAELVLRVNALSAGPGPAAVADTVPDPTATPPFDTEDAYTLLRHHFRRVRTDVGALVLVPTGPKQLVLPLLMAGLRLAAQEGIPMFLRQLIGGAMHQLPLRFGADSLLLELALHALDIVELDVAVRLLGSCSAGRELATRADQLRRALRCDHPASGANWPVELPPSLSRQDRSTGLAAQRVEIWADLATSHPQPAHGVRAVLGAAAVLERSIRLALPQQPEEKKHGSQAWELFKEQTDERARAQDRHARALCALRKVRNRQPISHGDGSVQDLEMMAARELRSRRPVTMAELLRLATTALQQWPGFHDVAAGTAVPTLSALLDQLRADVRTAQDAELARLARTQAGNLRTQTDLIDLLGAAVVEAVAPTTPEAGAAGSAR